MRDEPGGLRIRARPQCAAGRRDQRVELLQAEAGGASANRQASARHFKDFRYADARQLVAPALRVVAKAEWTNGEANPRFIVTSFSSKAETSARFLYEKVYCASRRDGEPDQGMPRRPKPFADRTSSATLCANQLRLWLASFAYALLCAVRRIGLAHTQFAEATCGTIRLKLLKLAGLVRVSARRIKFALASACPYADEWRLAAARLVTTA